MIQMPRAAAASAMAATVLSSMSAPVGLLGEFRMIAFVFGVIAPMIASACTAKPSSDRVGDNDRRGAHQLHLLRNSRPVRCVRDDLVALVEQGGSRVEQRLFAADGDEHFGRRDVDAVVLLDTVCRSLHAAPGCPARPCSG